MDDIKMQWYGVYPSSAFDKPKVLEQIKTLIVDEPEARIECDPVYPRMYVYTAMSWEFMRESLPKCLVSISDVRNRRPN